MGAGASGRRACFLLVYVVDHFSVGAVYFCPVEGDVVAAGYCFVGMSEAFAYCFFVDADTVGYRGPAVSRPVEG